MSKDEFDRALAEVDRKTAHLSDAEFQAEISLIVEEVRENPPIPSALLGVVYRNSEKPDHYEVSLTPTF